MMRFDVALITRIEEALIQAAYRARLAQGSAAPYVREHLREAELLAESARVQLTYAMLALDGGRGTP
jgi:hypothetical protein